MSISRKLEKKDKKEEETSQASIAATFAGVTETPSATPPSANVHICSGDSCSLTPPSAPMSSAGESMSFFQEEESFKSTNSTQPITPEENKIENVPAISEDTYALIASTLQYGFISSSGLTILSEILEPILKAQKYTAEQIYWINQFVRGLVLIGMGSSPITTISMPVLNYLLKEYLNVNKENATYITTGAVLGIHALTSPLGLIRASATITAGVASSVAGSKTAKYACAATVDVAKPLVKKFGLFQAPAASSSDEPLDYNELYGVPQNERSSFGSGF